MGTTAQKLQAILDSKAAIKDAIEGKGVTVGNASLDQYASKIEQIPAPIVEAPENDVNFYDYDGFRVASYTIAEAKALTALPTPPTHEGLTFQEWNWTLADIQGYNRRYADIGANYIPTDRKTHLKVKTDSDGKVSIGIWLKRYNDILLDWGDGNTETINTPSSTGTAIEKSHTYTTIGNHDITLSVQSGSDGFRLYFNTGYVSRNLLEINLGEGATGLVLLYAKCLVSLNKYAHTYFICQYIRVPNIIIPRECEYNFSVLRCMNGMKKMCFPLSIPNISGNYCVLSLSNTLVLPEFSDEGATQPAGITAASQLYTTRLSLPNSLKFSSTPSSSQFLSGWTLLREIDIAQGWTPNVSISTLGASTCYTKESIVDFFNKLGTTTNAITLTFGSTNLDKLTAEEKAIATNKGYTLA